MFSESAEFYDLIYSSFKDYSREAGAVAALLRRVHPRCRTILDAACGTGEHARLLAAEHGFEVDGLDLDPAFVRLAAAKHPAGRFYRADMTGFSLDRRYDAVLCLFSSIGYVRTPANLRRALECFRQHLAPGGVVIVEPWFPPGVLDPGHRETRTVEGRGLRIVRTSRTELEGRLSRIRFDYEIHGPDGVRHASELHELGLFTTEQLLETFSEVGLPAEHDPHGLTGRGLFVAQSPETPERRIVGFRRDDEGHTPRRGKCGPGS
jgi:SAM-dependent methyltransferase